MSLDEEAAKYISEEKTVKTVEEACSLRHPAEEASS